MSGRLGGGLSRDLNRQLARRLSRGLGGSPRGARKGGHLLARYAHIGGAAVGVLVAGAAAGVFAERKIAARGRGAGPEPLGSIRGQVRPVVADDGVRLYAEVDQARSEDGVDQAARPAFVFVHAYALNLDSWHFQRRALRGQYGMVLYDQRSHGRSSRSVKARCTIDQLGKDLAAVIDALVPDGPVVLVGHSMGGMTVMALAEQRPEWFGPRVVGVGLISTSAGGLLASTLGLPGMPGRVVHRVSPAVVATMARAPRLVERGRRAGADLGFAVTRRLSFGSMEVPPEYVDFTDEMLASTPIDVVADFFPGFDDHDKHAALEVLSGIPTVIIGGGRDAITPVEHSRRLAETVPTAEFVELAEAGHMVLLECHGEVSAALRRLAERAEKRGVPLRTRGLPL